MLSSLWLQPREVLLPSLPDEDGLCDGLAVPLGRRRVHSGGWSGVLHHLEQRAEQHGGALDGLLQQVRQAGQARTSRASTQGGRQAGADGPQAEGGEGAVSVQ